MSDLERGLTPGERSAALAERERIARLAEECNATYLLYYRRPNDAPFADLIRQGATRPPWVTFVAHPPDPLASEETT